MFSCGAPTAVRESFKPSTPNAAKQRLRKWAIFYLACGQLAAKSGDVGNMLMQQPTNFLAEGWKAGPHITASGSWYPSARTAETSSIMDFL